MADEVRLWRVGSAGELAEIDRGRLDLESRLQEWLASDISVLERNLLVIGREVETEYGGFIDLLCIDSDGNLVIVELKRDKTPREITAQGLDYASWVVDLSHERVTALADGYLGEGRLEDRFRERFHSDLPETLNGDHRLLIVGSEIDPGSERIIKYLSQRHGVDINAATFQYFREPDGHELLARVFLLEPAEVERHTREKGASKRRPNLTYDQLSELAAQAGVGESYAHAVAVLETRLQKFRTMSSIGFTGRLGGGRKTIISLLPGASSAEQGLRYQIYKNRYGQLAQLSPEAVEQLLPTSREDWSYGATTDPDYVGFEGFIVDRGEIDRLVQPLGHGEETHSPAATAPTNENPTPDREPQVA